MKASEGSACETSNPIASYHFLPLLLSKQLDRGTPEDGWGYSLQKDELGDGRINSLQLYGGIRACPFLGMNRNKKRKKRVSAWLSRSMADFLLARQYWGFKSILGSWMPWKVTLALWCLPVLSQQ